MAAAIAILLPPIPQPRWYHDFADQRAFLGIPNFLGAVSNAPFLLISAVAPARPASGRIALARASERRPYVVSFLGILLTAFASAWYHVAPDIGRRTGARLTLSFAFMGCLAAQTSERISPRAGRALLPLPLVAGPASVIHWSATDAAGARFAPLGLPAILSRTSDPSRASAICTALQPGK